MSILFSAIALAIAAPVAAPAQATPTSAQVPAPAKKPCCCEKMEKPMACCDKPGDQAEHPAPAADPHAGHNMNQ